MEGFRLRKGGHFRALPGADAVHPEGDRPAVHDQVGHLPGDAGPLLKARFLGLGAREGLLHLMELGLPGPELLIALTGYVQSAALLILQILERVGRQILMQLQYPLLPPYVRGRPGHFQILNADGLLLVVKVRFRGLAGRGEGCGGIDFLREVCREPEVDLTSAVPLEPALGVLVLNHVGYLGSREEAQLVLVLPREGVQGSVRDQVHADVLRVLRRLGVGSDVLEDALVDGVLQLHLAVERVRAVVGDQLGERLELSGADHVQPAVAVVLHAAVLDLVLRAEGDRVGARLSGRTDQEGPLQTHTGQHLLRLPSLHARVEPGLQFVVGAVEAGTGVREDLLEGGGSQWVALVVVNQGGNVLECHGVHQLVFIAVGSILQSLHQDVVHF